MLFSTLKLTLGYVLYMVTWFYYFVCTQHNAHNISGRPPESTPRIFPGVNGGGGGGGGGGGVYLRVYTVKSITALI